MEKLQERLILASEIIENGWLESKTLPEIQIELRGFYYVIPDDVVLGYLGFMDNLE